MGDERPVQWHSHNVSRSPINSGCRHDINFRRGISGGPGCNLIMRPALWLPPRHRRLNVRRAGNPFLQPAYFDRDLDEHAYSSRCGASVITFVRRPKWAV